MSVLKGFENLFDEELAGTASEYYSTIENIDKFFLYYFTYDCSDYDIEYHFNSTIENCLSLKKYLQEGDQFAISMRNYIKPVTQRGSDSSKLLPPMVLELHK